MNTAGVHPTRLCSQCKNVLPDGILDTDCPHCLLGLGQAVPDPATHVSSEPAHARRHTDPTQIFGDYELLELLGKGGMGMVYKARQLSLDRLVAVKMIRADPIPHPDVLERFRREARTVAQLRHPGIVTVHEVGEVDGQPYFSMELIEGGTLAQRVRMPPLPARPASAYIRAVAEAIHYAHQQGVLHRDLKPSNILVDPFDQPKVSDFGVAKLLGEDSDLTLTGQRIGSPSYMAPEQACGRGDRVDARTDVYALGAVLYHLVSGHPPFLADTTERALLQVINQDPIPLRRLNPSVSRDLETICAKCLEKDPARRYPRAQALAEDLERFLEGVAIHAQPVGRMGKAWRWCRRNPLPASLGAAAALLLLVVAIGGPIAATRQAALAESNRRIAYGAALAAAWQSRESGNITRTVDLLASQIPSPGQKDLREFTWRYLWKLSEPARKRNWVADPSDAILLSALSRDGSRLATSGLFGDVTIWDVPTRSIVCRLNTGGLTSGGLAFTPDGRRLVTTGRHAFMGVSNHLQIWDAATGARVEQRHPWTFLGDFSPDGRWFAAGRGTDIVVRDVSQNWHEVRSWPAHQTRVWDVRWSPDGTKLVSAGGLDTTAKVWNASTGEEICQLTGHTREVRCAVFSPEGRMIATTGEDRTVRFWNVDSGTERTGLSYPHPAGLHELAWSSDGTWFASASFDGLVLLRHWQTGSTWTLRGHAQSVTALRFAPGADLLITASLDGLIRFWDLAQLPPCENDLESAAGEMDMEYAPLAFSPHSRWVATANSNATEVLLWRVATGELESRIRILARDLHQRLPVIDASTTPMEVADLVFLDGMRLAVACEVADLPPGASNRLFLAVWDFQHDTLIDAFLGGRPLRLSPDGKRLAMLDGAGVGVQVRELATGHVWPLPNRAATLRHWGDLSFSPDGRMLAVACGSPYKLLVLETATGELLGEFKGSRVGPINAMALTKDGERLFTGGYLRRLQIWDVRRRAFIEEWAGHTNHVRAMAMSPNGKTLVTGSDNGLIKFWSVAQRTELLTVQAHNSRILNLAFSPDGCTLASAGMEGTARLWRAAPAE